MKLRNSISETILNATVALLQPSCPDITPTLLVSALKQFDPECTGSRPAPMLTRREAANILSISLPTLDRMIASGELPRIKRKRVLRIPADAVYAIAEGRDVAVYDR